MKFEKLTYLLEFDENDEELDTKYMPPVVDPDPTDSLPETDKAPETDPGTESDAKSVNLIAQDVEISKRILDEEEILQIKSKLDPNMKGYVKYDNAEDLDIAYRNINTIGDVLNYMNVNTKTRSSAFGWNHILAKEILTMKRDMTTDEIADLRLDFKI